MSQRKPGRKTRCPLCGLSPIPAGPAGDSPLLAGLYPLSLAVSRDLLEVKLDRGPQHISDGLVAQADGRTELPSRSGPRPPHSAGARLARRLWPRLDSSSCCPRPSRPSWMAPRSGGGHFSFLFTISVQLGCGWVRE